MITEDIIMAFDLLEKVFTAANTAERISATRRTCTSVTFQIKRGNSNAVQIAPKTFVTGKGFELVKPEADKQLPEKSYTSSGKEGIDLYDWYAMGAQNEGINIIIDEF
jgi:hypothetical protein